MCLIVAKRTTVYCSKELMNIIKIVNNEMFIRQQKTLSAHSSEYKPKCIWCVSTSAWLVVSK